MIHLPRNAEARRRRDDIAELARNLDNQTIDTLLHRAKYAAADTLMAPTGGAGNDVSRPTEAAAIRHAGGRNYLTENGSTVETPDTWRGEDDPVRDSIAALFAELAEAHGLLRSIDRRRAYILAISDNQRGRVNTVDLCAACNEPAPKVKRLDGQPYHHPDPINGEQQPQCWWHAYRQKRGTEAEQEQAS